jgi:dihydropteroate synthase
MGILNVTPDSFSDGGLHDSVEAAVSAGARMIADGADLIDIGGESTRPGAALVSPAEEQARILPVIRSLAARGALISVDTRNAATMAAALESGAHIVNDVSGLTHDPDARAVVAAYGCPVVLMHMRGTPETMQAHGVYDDVVREVSHELGALVEAAERAGIRRDAIAIDPGIGFAKTAAHSMALLSALPELARFGCPLLVGVSRKAFIGRLGQEPEPARRMPGSLAAALFAHQQGADILRVHDVSETRQALRVWSALNSGAEHEAAGRD